MSYADSAMHRLTMLAVEHDRLCDVRVGQTFRTVPSIESGRSTTSTFRDVAEVETFRINGQPFMDVTTSNGETFTASAWTPVDIIR